jgi:hypothetical protein
MPIEADVILAFGTFFTALISGAIAFYTFMNSATRQEIRDLRKRVVCLEKENLSMHGQVLGLQRENMWLRLVLAKAGIEIPPMPPLTVEEQLVSARRPLGVPGDGNLNLKEAEDE